MTTNTSQQELIEAVTALAQHWPEALGVILAAASFYGAYKAGNTKEARQLSYKLENRIHKLLDSVGFHDPDRKEVDIQFINDNLPQEIADFDRTHSDGTYFTATESEIKSLLNMFQWVKYLPYRYDTFDCEQYARLLKVLIALRYGITTVGVVTDYKAAHAYNVFMASDGSVFYVEPQEMETVQPGQTRTVGTQSITYLKEGGDGRLLF